MFQSSRFQVLISTETVSRHLFSQLHFALLNVSTRPGHNPTADAEYEFDVGLFELHGPDAAASSCALTANCGIQLTGTGSAFAATNAARVVDDTAGCGADNLASVTGWTNPKLVTSDASNDKCAGYNCRGERIPSNFRLKRRIIVASVSYLQISFDCNHLELIAAPFSWPLRLLFFPGTLFRPRQLLRWEPITTCAGPLLRLAQTSRTTRPMNIRHAEECFRLL